MLINPATDFLLAVDVQPDFMPGGALAVPDGDAVIAPINRLLGLFAHAVATQDWHPAGHASFASAHPGRAAFASIDMPYGPQTLWPDHCVQGTPGAALHPALEQGRLELVAAQGVPPGRGQLLGVPRERSRHHHGPGRLAPGRGVGRVFLAGLATDFCVAWSAEDAVMAGSARW